MNRLQLRNARRACAGTTFGGYDDVDLSDFVSLERGHLEPDTPAGLD